MFVVDVPQAWNFLSSIDSYRHAGRVLPNLFLVFLLSGRVNIYTMILKAAVTISLLGTTYALSVPGNHYRRDDTGSPSDQDLLSSCPGGPGASDLKKADRCTLVSPPAYFKWRETC